MAIWPTDDPTGTHPSEAGDDMRGPCGETEEEWLDDILRAELDAATRADLWIDEQSGTDYDGEDWPF